MVSGQQEVMKKYQVKIYKGDYSARQRAANADKALIYIEQHFNSVANPEATYTHAKVAVNASNTSIRMAKFYAERVSKEFGTKLGFGDGVDSGGRGNGNLLHTNMPAILLEPMFVSNPGQAAIVKSEDGQNRLAACLADTVKSFCPNGGLIAFSIGHIYKTSAPNDRGAAVVGGGTEAQYAEIVMNKAKAMLESD